MCEKAFGEIRWARRTTFQELQTGFTPAERAFA
jgi:hypothetical protein